MRLKGKLTPEMKVGSTELKGFTTSDLYHFLLKAVQHEGVE